MVDAIIGTWKGSFSDSAGLKDYLEAIGHAELFEHYQNNVVTVVKKESDTRFSYESTVEGFAKKITGIVEVGAKTIDVYPGIGPMEVDTAIEGGNKIVSKAVYNGIQIKKSIYAEGDNLITEFAAGGVSFKSVSKRI